jgi:hypothetical protein
VNRRGNLCVNEGEVVTVFGESTSVFGASRSTANSFDLLGFPRDQHVPRRNAVGAIPGKVDPEIREERIIGARGKAQPLVLGDPLIF